MKRKASRADTQNNLDPPTETKQPKKKRPPQHLEQNPRQNTQNKALNQKREKRLGTWQGVSGFTFAVRALNSLQKFIMLTPSGPRTSSKELKTFGKSSKSAMIFQYQVYATNRDRFEMEVPPLAGAGPIAAFCLRGWCTTPAPPWR